MIAGQVVILPCDDSKSYQIQSKGEDKMRGLEDYYKAYKWSMLFDDESLNIPKRTKRALDKWACWAEPNGDFIMAVLRNDLMRAISRADLENQKAIVDIVKYVYNRLPSQCWGSEEAVESWEGLEMPEQDKENK